MKNIVVQAGHINCENNIDPGIRKSTGSPGEKELTLRIANRVSAMLRDRGYNVIQTDANANSDKKITEKDFDLFLALHGDADSPNDKGGGMVGSGDPSVDMSWERSKEIAEIIQSVYFREADIVDKQYTTPGMRLYYMWKYLSDKTPCVLLEMGQTQDPHDKVLLSNTTLIASSIVRSICKVFNTPYDLPNNTTDPHIKEIEELKIALDRSNSALIKANADFQSALAVKESVCQGYKKRLEQIAVISKL